MVFTSRGCPRRCGFCSLPGSPAGKYRVKSPGRVIQEIRFYVNRYGIGHFDIEDDSFTADPARAEKILDALCLESGGEIEFSAMNGIDYTTLSPALIRKMKRAGFKKLDISAVTCDAKSLSEAGRAGSNRKLYSVIRAAEKENLETEVHFIIGLPTETWRKTLKTLFYLSKKPVIPGGSVFYPVPGSLLFRRGLKEGWIGEKDDPSLWRSSLAYADRKSYSRKKQITILFLTRIVHFLKRLSGLERYENVSMRKTARRLLKKISFPDRDKYGLELLDLFFRKREARKLYFSGRYYYRGPRYRLDDEVLVKFLNRNQALKSRLPSRLSR